MLAVIGGIFAFIVVCIVGFVIYGQNNNFLVGMIPILMNEEKIKETNIPDLTGKVIIVTGANSGLGKSTVKHLAKNGATVIMACRSSDKSHQAKQEIISEIKNSPFRSFKEEKLVELKLDLGSLKSVQNFSAAFLAKFDRLDSLILNAGIAQVPFGLTTDGLERHFGVNHAAHFYLTKLLLPLLEKSQPSTIVSVSSAIHHMSYETGVHLDVNKLNSPIGYAKFAAYGQSKLANLLFAQELSERLVKEKKEIYVNAVHPGSVNTEVARHFPKFAFTFIKTLFNTFPNVFGFESDLASLVEVYAAVSDDIVSNKITGKYMVPIGQIVDTHPLAKNKALQKEVWKLTESILEDRISQLK